VAHISFLISNAKRNVTGTTYQPWSAIFLSLLGGQVLKGVTQGRQPE